MPNEMTAAEAAEIIERGDEGQRRYDAEDTAVRLLRKIASGEYAPIPIRCIECEHSLPMDMKKYPDLTCHLSGGDFRVRVDMSCPCAKRAGKDDNHETD